MSVTWSDGVERKTVSAVYADRLRQQASSSDCPSWLLESLSRAADQIEKLQAVIEQVQGETAFCGLPETLQEQIDEICKKEPRRAEESIGG